jgi:hypothetical protein
VRKQLDFAAFDDVVFGVYVIASAAAQVTALADPFLCSTVLPLLVSNCLSPTPNDPSKPHTHRHERCRCPRRAQHARQEAG